MRKTLKDTVYDFKMKSIRETENNLTNDLIHKLKQKIGNIRKSTISEPYMRKSTLSMAHMRQMKEVKNEW